MGPEKRPKKRQTGHKKEKVWQRRMRNLPEQKLIARRAEEDSRKKVSSSQTKANPSKKYRVVEK